MVQEHNKEIFIWKTRVFQFHLCQEKTGTEKVWFGHAFWCRVTNFKPHLLSPQKSKLKNFSAHQQEEFLRISKLTLLLFLVPILKELWQFETSGHFFWDTLYIRAVHLNKILSDGALLLVWSSRHIAMTFLLKKLFSGGLITLAPGLGRKERIS